MSVVVNLRERISNLSIQPFVAFRHTFPNFDVNLILSEIIKSHKNLSLNIYYLNIVSNSMDKWYIIAETISGEYKLVETSPPSNQNLDHLSEVKRLSDEIQKLEVISDSKYKEARAAYQVCKENIPAGWIHPGARGDDGFGNLSLF